MTRARPLFMGRPSIFFKAKNPALAKAIRTDSPKQFRASFGRVKRVKSATPLQKRRALTLAQTRAKAQLKRKTLSGKERREFTTISRIKIPTQSQLK